MPPRPELPPAPSEARKGRGATLNPAGRFERHTREPFADSWSDPGWSHGGGTDYVPPPIRTEVSVDSTKSIIAYNQSPDIGFDRSINPYRGCEHGCVYCFARPTHGYFGLSAGLDFETKLFAKPNAAALLEAELAAPKYRCQPIAMGTNTDPYQPIERSFRVTRSILEVLERCDHPVTLVTKGALVARDVDILARMAKKNLAWVGLSVTTLDRELARRMEPRAATPARRLAAMRALADAGVPVGVMVAPVIPALNDHEVEAILEAARDAGASSAGLIMVRLPHEIKDLMADWLDVHAPLKKKRVLELIRGMRKGKLNDGEFGSRFRPTGGYAGMIRQRFAVAARRLGLEREGRPLDCSQFRRPIRRGEQLALL
ncbi:MAG: PA0069 family radical SAM protein [Rhodospirillaceae bacterium]|nr:PA0069 family radical SAM protein [Rhodospirillaceae bacterium]